MSPSPSAKHSKLSVITSPEEDRLNTWIQLIRTISLFEKEIGSLLSRHELTLPQFDMLATLRFREGVTQKDLATRLLVTKGNICGLLNRLEEMGWVVRRVDPEDSRANRLYLTSAGRRKIDGAIPVHNERILEMLSPLRNTEIRLTKELLTKLERNLSIKST